MAHTMTDDELLENLDFPTLSSVVESGDETIIQTSRIGHEVIRELRSIGAYSEPHIHVGADTSAVSLPAARSATQPTRKPSTGPAFSPRHKTHHQTDYQQLAQIIESKVAAVVEKHVTALKKDINSTVLEALEQHQKQL